MTAIKITQAAADQLAAVRETGKTPWVIILEGKFLVGVYAGRAEARAAKTDGFENGKVMKADDAELEVEPPPAPVEQPKVEKEINRKSTASGPCRLVWEIAERMEGQRRKDIIAACVEAGVAFYTARTQYQLWLTIRNEERAREAVQKAQNVKKA